MQDNTTQPISPSRRLPRFQRAGPDALPFIPQERDLAAWLWIYDCRFLSLEYLHLLLGGSSQQLTRRAQRWFHAGTVARVRTGLNQFLLAITDDGADAVCARFDRDRGKIRWNAKNRELKNLYFREHSLSTARLIVTLVLGLRENALQQAEDEMFNRWPRAEQARVLDEALVLLRRYYHSARWEPSVFEEKARGIVLENLVDLEQVATGLIPQLRLPSLERVHRLSPRLRLKPGLVEEPLTYVDDRGRTRTLVPDRSFTLINGDDELRFHLETDRSTTSLKTVFDKRDMLAKYRKYWRHFRQEQDKASRGDLSARHRFRVLTTGLTRERSDHMRELARQADDRHSGSELFWFTSEDRYNPHLPASIWQPLWQTPRDDAVHRLLD